VDGCDSDTRGRPCPPDAQLSQRRAKSDQSGTAESLRLMVQHEDVLRQAARHQGDLTGRLRADAAASAARCERVAGKEDCTSPAPGVRIIHVHIVIWSF
jgi:hypothetical protein